MSLKIKKRKLWILNTTILTIGVAVVPIAVNCGNDVKITEISVANLQDKTTLESGRWSGVEAVAGTMVAYTPPVGIFGNVNVEYYQGDNTDTVGDKIADLSVKAFSNGNFVWIRLVAKSGYVWPKEVDITAKEWTRVDATKIQIKLTVKDLKEAISVSSLQDKATLESGRWSGVEAVANTMTAYALPADITDSHATIEYYQGDNTDTLGTKIADLADKEFSNGDFVWIRLVAKSGYGWPQAADVTAKGWTHINDTTIQIKLTVKDLKEAISVSSLQDKVALESGRWSGVEAVANTMTAYVLPAGITDSHATIEYYHQGSDPLAFPIKIADLTRKAFSNGDSVAIILVAKSGYGWPKAANVIAKGWTRLNDTKIEIQLTVKNLKIHVGSLQNKVTLESGRWSGTQGTIGTMTAYVPTVGITGNVDVEYYQGDDTDTLGTKIVDLADKAFSNGNFVWIRLVAKSGYGWPRVADIAARGWIYGDGATIQIKLTVKDLT